MKSSELTRRLGIHLPILSAPMAGVAGGALAAAVSGAGGLGFIGGGYGDRSWLECELDRIGAARVGVGFITWSLVRKPDLLDLVLDRGVVAVMLSFGDIQAFAPRITHAGVALVAQVQTVADARRAAAEGAAVIVAQGAEAGGHGGRRSTMALVPAVVDAVPDVPIVAAGGIADGRGIAAALMLGASGVLCGTAFYAANESLAHPAAKVEAIRASGDDTAKGAVFDAARGFDWPEPWTIRTLRNPFYDRWEAHLAKLRNDDEERRLFAEAQVRGDVRIAPVIVGEGVDLVRMEAPAARILDRMVNEALQSLHSSQAASEIFRGSGRQRAIGNTLFGSLQPDPDCADLAP